MSFGAALTGALGATNDRFARELQERLAAERRQEEEERTLRLARAKNQMELDREQTVYDRNEQRNIAAMQAAFAASPARFQERLRAKGFVDGIVDTISEAMAVQRALARRDTKIENRSEMAAKIGVRDRPKAVRAELDRLRERGDKTFELESDVSRTAIDVNKAKIRESDANIAAIPENRLAYGSYHSRDQMTPQEMQEMEGLIPPDLDPQARAMIAMVLRTGSKSEFSATIRQAINSIYGGSRGGGGGEDPLSTQRRFGNARDMFQVLMRDVVSAQGGTADDMQKINMILVNQTALSRGDQNQLYNRLMGDEGLSPELRRHLGSAFSIAFHITFNDSLSEEEKQRLFLAVREGIQQKQLSTLAADKFADEMGWLER